MEIIGQPDANFGVTNLLNQDGSRILVGGPSYTSNTGVVEVYRLVNNAWTKWVVVYQDPPLVIILVNGHK